jgi:hypothetical protein
VKAVPIIIVAVLAVIVVIVLMQYRGQARREAHLEQQQRQDYIEKKRSYLAGLPAVAVAEWRKKTPPEMLQILPNEKKLADLSRDWPTEYYDMPNWQGWTTVVLMFTNYSLSRVSFQGAYPMSQEEAEWLAQQKLGVTLPKAKYAIIEGDRGYDGLEGNVRTVMFPNESIARARGGLPVLLQKLDAKTEPPFSTRTLVVTFKP